MRFRVLVGLVATALPTADAQTVRVAVDPRLEAIGILFRIAGVSDFTNGSVQPYIRRIDSAFVPFRGHAVFAEVRRLRAQPGLSLSAIASLAPQITDPVTFDERAPIDAPSSMLASAWRGVEARPFLSLARDFAQKARLGEFLLAQQPTFDSAAARLQRVAKVEDVRWLTAFFGAPAGDVMIVSPMLINASANFGADFRDASVHERHAYIGIGTSDSLGFPVVNPDAAPLVTHELSHSFVNPVVGSLSSLEPAGEQIYRGVQQPMRALAYTSWRTMLNESVVRATVVRFLRWREGPAAAIRETRVQQGRGFIWMDELVDLLGEYEADRARYRTLAEFTPRLVEYYEDLAPRMEQKLADFERNRPRIIYSSILDTASAVDPGLTSITFRFDKPVDTIINLVGNHGGGTPELTSAVFDSTHTILTLGVKLEPGRAYILPLGPGAFVGREGFPLVELRLRFRTR
jgi:hypothetical protein